MSNYIKRIVPVILVLALCISCLVSPASAVSDSTMYELLDYSSLNDSGSNYVSFIGSKSVEYDIPYVSIIRYVDMVISMVGAVSSVSVGYDSVLKQLNVVQIGNDLYRVYGSIPSVVYEYLTIYFDSASTSYSWYTILSIKISATNYSSFPSLGSLNVWDSLSGSTTISMSSSSDEPEVYLTQDPGSTVSYADFISCVYLSEWKKYDYMDVSLYLDVEHINTISVRHVDTFLDFDVSYLTPADSINTFYWVLIHVDLSKVDRSSTVSPKIDITGTYYNQVDYNKIRLKSITGFAVLPDPSSLLSFWYNLRSFLSSSFSNLSTWISNQTTAIQTQFTQLKTSLSSWFSTQFSKLDQVIDELKILNGTDSEAKDAQQTQEEINVSINNQLVGAVEDWNTNIEVVETGYDMAFSKTTPALTWLASLADGIFNGMGWFGNVYFLIGLISVIMLVLSKSGLAHKIGSISRRKGD